METASLFDLRSAMNYRNFIERRHFGMLGMRSHLESKASNMPLLWIAKSAFIDYLRNALPFMILRMYNNAGREFSLRCFQRNMKENQ